MGVSPRPKLEPEVSGKTFGPDLSLRDDLFIFMLTVADDMLALSYASTATNVAVFITSLTEYHGGCTVDGDKIKKVPAHCKQFRLEAVQRENVQAE